MNIREFIDIVDNAGRPFTDLQDAGFRPGDTEVWFAQEKYQNIMAMGYDELKRRGALPSPETLSKTHSLLGSIDETDPQKVHVMFQAESWDPNNQAQAMLDNLHIDHASMGPGDAILVHKQKFFLIDKDGSIVAVDRKS